MEVITQEENEQKDDEMTQIVSTDKNQRDTSHLTPEDGGRSF